MNILIINHYAGSPQYGMEYRHYYLAREWVKMGHTVFIVAADYSHLRIEQPKQKQEVIDGINYVWLSTPQYYGNGVGRVKNMLSFVWQVYWYAHKNLFGVIFNVVIASSTYPLDIYPAYYIADKHNAKLVFEAHDIWPLTPMEIGNMSRYHPFIMMMQIAEDFMCRHVDKLVSILPKAEEHYLKHGLTHGKFFHIPNGVAIDKTNCHDNVALSKSYSNLFKKLRKKETFIIGYVGGIAKSNALNILLEAAYKVKDMPIDIVIVGNGIEKESLLEYKKRNCMNQVHFLPAICKDMVPSLLSQMDALYIGWQETKLYEYGVSANKVFDYMLSAKPIIWAGKTGNNPVKEANAGIFVDSSNPMDIANAIVKMVGMDKRQLIQWGINGSVFVKENYNYKKLASDFILLLGI